MALKKYRAVLTAAATALSLCGCSEIRHSTPYLEMQAAEYSVIATEETETAAVTTAATTTTMITGPDYSEIPLDVPYLDIRDTELVYQAEDTELTVAFRVSNTKTDYTGSGYVSGLQGALQNTFVFKVYVPTSQHYDITLVICAENGAEFTLLVNDEEIGDIAAEANERFVSITVPGIYMEAGESIVSVCQKDGDMLLDCLELKNNTSLSPNRYIEAVPCTPEASKEAVMLLDFMTSSYSKGIISGQHVSSGSSDEIVHIVETTGKYPAIRFADMYFASSNGGDPENTDTIKACLDWSKQGGITGLMWHWYAPLGGKKTLVMSDGFSLSAAVTAEDAANASPEELEVMLRAGAVSEELVAIINDIDAVSEQLKALRDADIPVLWRPLHQAGSGLYWWESEGSESYLWLWELMFVRMTEYHSLNNLIWVWSGVSAEYLPDESLFDIASADVYAAEGEEFGSGYEAFYALQELASGKLVALSECSSLPDVTKAFRDGSVWSYFGLWYEPYLSSEDNSFTDSETLINTYNSEGVFTREDYISFCAQYRSAASVTATVSEAE